MNRATRVAAPVNPLSGFALQDQDGAEVQLDDLWRDRAAALVFLRHYLCVQCRVGAMELERDRHLLPPDPNVWLVGMGTPVQARAFKQQTGVKFPVLLSTDLQAYEAMDLPRGSLRQIFGPAAQRVARRRAKGVGLDRQADGGNRPKARPEQDWHQLGGAFVFAPGGSVVWSHRARHAGDDPEHALLAQALREADPAYESPNIEPGRQPGGGLTMPMLDAYIPEGALTPQAEERLLNELTDLLIRHEGADPANPQVRSIAWVFLHRPAAVLVGGEPASEPRYRFVTSVPEGQFDSGRRQGMVDAITQAVLDAEAGAYERDPMRVWVFTPEVPDGTWGAGGRVVTLADIATFAIGDPVQGRRYADERLGPRLPAQATVSPS